jgi:hypothetical protein
LAHSSAARTRQILLLSLILLSSALGVDAAHAAPADNRPVTQEQFRQLVKIFKNVVNRLDRVEKQVKDIESRPGGPSKKEEVIDLGASDAKVMSAPVEAASTRVGAHGGSLAMPTFKVYFDLDLIHRPGTGNNVFTFTNFHTFLFFEIIPTPDIQFSFDMNGQGSPNYYELDYQATPRLQLRFGKIWIPFDDLSPHNIFGGRTNVSRLRLAGDAFLPDLWAELGLGLKYQLIESKTISMTGWVYIVNGFGSGGTDPRQGGTNYPSFAGSAVGTLDNNRDKAIGGRIHTLLGRKWGFGFSFYSGRWNDETSSVAQRVNIVGIDSQLRLRATEFRAGLASMAVGLPGGPGEPYEPTPTNTNPGKSFTRGGYYVEAGQKLGREQQWKLLGRFGFVQTDNRVLSAGDQQLVGGTLLWKPGLIEYSFEHSRDLLKRDDKISYSYSAFRIIMAF